MRGPCPVHLLAGGGSTKQMLYPKVLRDLGGQYQQIGEASKGQNAEWLLDHLQSQLTLHDHSHFLALPILCASVLRSML